MPFRETLLNLAITCVLVLIITLVALLVRQSRPEVAKAIPIATARPATEGPAQKSAPKADFEVFPKAQLVESKNNEADTLRIKPSPTAEEAVFRLYFVDAPETTLSSPQTVQEQARYFDASQENVLKVGVEAAAYVTELLKTRPFMLYTRWEPVPDRTRYYGMIKVSLKPGEYTHLADILMKRGYGRLHGLTCELPDGVQGINDYGRYLLDLGKKAREDKIGIWGR
jgi:hypothetical protein